MGAGVQVVDQGGCVCPDLGENLCGGGSGGYVVWVRDMGANTENWEASGWIPPQGGPQADVMTTSEREGLWVGVYPSSGSDGRGRVIGCGNLSLLPPEKVTLH